MRSDAEIIKLSDKKFEVAECLLDNGFYDDAYYLGGYAFELRLKAKICKILGIPDFFDFDSAKSRKLLIGNPKRGEKENLYKPFKVHDFEQLLILSGLFNEFSNNFTSRSSFRTDWSVICKWDENLRYSSGSNKSDVETFFKSMKNMLLWIQSYL